MVYYPSICTYYVAVYSHPVSARKIVGMTSVSYPRGMIDIIAFKAELFFLRYAENDLIGRFNEKQRLQFNRRTVGAMSFIGRPDKYLES